MERIPLADLLARYCGRQDNEPAALMSILRKQRENYRCEGWFLAENQMLGTAGFGTYVILPYGPNNTFQTVPHQPFSPRGLASDMSVAVAYALATDMDSQ
jgi:hypothetical protein